MRGKQGDENDGYKNAQTKLWMNIKQMLSICLGLQALYAQRVDQNNISFHTYTYNLCKA